jgi:DNA-binding NarL/FixJ family response regulator
MPGMSGLEATKMISQRCPETKVLVLTQFDEEDNMLAARNMGAHGFIPKRAAGKELVTGVRTVDRGGYFPASFADVSAN